MLKTEHINTGQSIVRKKRLYLLMNLNKNLLKQMLQTYLLLCSKPIFRF